MANDLKTSHLESEIEKRPHLAKFFDRVNPTQGRLIFAIDATASRQPTWDIAAELTTQMFEAIDSVGRLEVQLVYYRGRECVASRWFSDAKLLAQFMSKVICIAGITQIERVFAHAVKENRKKKINALVMIGDACEEHPNELLDQARLLSDVPIFMFQEGADEHVARVYGQIADITHGAFCKFDSNASQQLADLLKAVAAFAAGGIKALSAQNSDAARLLLTQMKS
ncbi:hypothetical protein [Bradyrhizobium elkanii]|uniref:hypothetical protein n=1 Tax=Bradyrhizobium elkanii TaxID=29448 RepID=UPI00041D8C14|nr:hypothetical protein [Bradyrhizobium elkanii]